ncbi:MAG: DUF5615 family PIN-like protein [Candidatus Rokuibacteriota bacterium]
MTRGTRSVLGWLRRRGHDAIHLREEGLHRARDEQVLAEALAEDRIVLTFPREGVPDVAEEPEATASMWWPAG